MNTQSSGGGRTWAEGQTARIGDEVFQLRKRQKLTAQQLADRTRELGLHVKRTAITDLEIGRRKHLTVAELTVLARALNTSPVALMFPGPYYGKVEVLPGVEASEIRAVQWFSGIPGLTEGVVVALADDPVEYRKNLKRLRLAREVWDLDENRIALTAQMAATDKPDEKAQLVDA